MLNREEPTTQRVMLCTGDQTLCAHLGGVLRRNQYEVCFAADSESALEQLEADFPDAMLCDLALPGQEGMALLNRIRRERDDLFAMPIILLSEFGDKSDIVAGKMAGADDYFVKPVDGDLLIASLAAQLRMTTRVRRTIIGSVSMEAGGPRLRAAYALFDRLSFGVIFFDTHGNSIFHNRAAHSLSRGNTSKIRS
ncbi:response regulator transcription factor [Paracoccus sp. SCSIO 75233]|uniref:response regulator transcription factor n=1 Tax=Paracoccus sp. SCSIO 75233 TaxID=3017782 RepID=UPI0022F063C7|nr:response regulator [Paracoccus sp. SCSIO 75233]WBU52622.1 response regulator [Paracoccus sp. SCSIO 75233]